MNINRHIEKMKKVQEVNPDYFDSAENEMMRLTGKPITHYAGGRMWMPHMIEAEKATAHLRTPEALKPDIDMVIESVFPTLPQRIGEYIQQKLRR